MDKIRKVISALLEIPQSSVEVKKISYKMYKIVVGTFVTFICIDDIDKKRRLDQIKFGYKSHEDSY